MVKTSTLPNADSKYAMCGLWIQICEFQIIPLQHCMPTTSISLYLHEFSLAYDIETFIYNNTQEVGGIAI